MKVSLWAEIRRLYEIEGLKRRAIARRLHCCNKTVSRALQMESPPLPTSPSGTPPPSAGILAAYHRQIDGLIAKYPELSAMRVCEEISRGPEGYRGSVYAVRRYLRKTRPAGGRVYQEVFYEPGEAMQVDWGDCGWLTIGQTKRRVSVFVAVLCYSRLCYIEFTLSQRKAEFYRALVNALNFFGGSPKKIIIDNLKAAVINGSGRHACLHPEFLALCGHFFMEAIACASRDPESKGLVEGNVRYVKGSALAGRSDELIAWDDYRRLASIWRDEVANVRLHAATHERPIDRFQKERDQLRPLPANPFDTDEILSAPVTFRWQPLFRAAGVGSQDGHTSGQCHGIANHRSGPGGGRASTLLREKAIGGSPRSSAGRLEDAPAAPGRAARDGVRRLGPGGETVPPEAVIDAREGGIAPTPALGPGTAVRP